MPDQNQQPAPLGIGPDELESINKTTSGKLLGIDYGTKRIGLAISDNEQKQAFIYDTLTTDNSFFTNISQIIEDELIDKIIVGLPLSLKGEYTDKTNEVVSFIEELEIRTKAIVETVDERLSSQEADKTSNKNQRDQESARIILQQYLDKV